jgi:hypothetical protein
MRVITKGTIQPFENYRCKFMFFSEFLVDDNRLDGAFVRRLLNGVFVLGGNFFDHYLCHVVTHLENFRTGVNAKVSSILTLIVIILS